LEGVQADYGTIQESIALYAWRKQQRIKLLDTIAVVVANVNPDKAQKALSDLIEEMFPEQKFEREQAVEKAMEIMEKERKKVFAVKKAYPEKPKGLVRRVNKVLSRG